MHGARGFTLIELSVVLVIIGLIVGGILVGYDLIKAAEVRAAIAQLDKFQSASNTFYAKYGGLPGDLPAAYASQFGFIARGAVAGQGDGNGLIQGSIGNYGDDAGGYSQISGETVVFWVDLSQAGLIEGTFNTATESTIPPGVITNVSAYLPQAKIGNQSWYVWSGGINWADGRNYFGLLSISAINGNVSCIGCSTSSPALTARQAFNIDKKIDDGLPQTGVVTATFLTEPFWASGTPSGGTPDTSATPETTTTCYDNNNVAGAVQQYSLGSLANYGTGLNCALSFQMHGAGR